MTTFINAIDSWPKALVAAVFFASIAYIAGRVVALWEKL